MSIPILQNIPRDPSLFDPFNPILVQSLSPEISSTTHRKIQQIPGIPSSNPCSDGSSRVAPKLPPRDYPKNSVISQSSSILNNNYYNQTNSQETKELLRIINQSDISSIEIILEDKHKRLKELAYNYEQVINKFTKYRNSEFRDFSRFYRGNLDKISAIHDSFAKINPSLLNSKKSSVYEDYGYGNIALSSTHTNNSLLPKEGIYMNPKAGSSTPYGKQTSSVSSVFQVGSPSSSSIENNNNNNSQLYMDQPSLHLHPALPPLLPQKTIKNLSKQSQNEINSLEDKIIENLALQQFLASHHSTSMPSETKLFLQITGCQKTDLSIKYNTIDDLIKFDFQDSNSQKEFPGLCNALDMLCNKIKQVDQLTFEIVNAETDVLKSPNSLLRQLIGSCQHPSVTVRSDHDRLQSRATSEASNLQKPPSLPPKSNSKSSTSQITSVSGINYNGSLSNALKSLSSTNDDNSNKKHQKTSRSKDWLAKIGIGSSRNNSKTSSITNSISNISAFEIQHPQHFYEENNQVERITSIEELKNSRDIAMNKSLSKEDLSNLLAGLEMQDKQEKMSDNNRLSFPKIGPRHARAKSNPQDLLNFGRMVVGIGSLGLVSDKSLEPTSSRKKYSKSRSKSREKPGRYQNQHTTRQRSSHSLCSESNSSKRNSVFGTPKINKSPLLTPRSKGSSIMSIDNIEIHPNKIDNTPSLGYYADSNSILVSRKPANSTIEEVISSTSTCQFTNSNRSDVTVKDKNPLKNTLFRHAERNQDELFDKNVKKNSFHGPNKQNSLYDFDDPVEQHIEPEEKLRKHSDILEESPEMINSTRDSLMDSDKSLKHRVSGLSNENQNQNDEVESEFRERKGSNRPSAIKMGKTDISLSYELGLEQNPSWKKPEITRQGNYTGGRGLTRGRQERSAFANKNAWLNNLKDNGSIIPFKNLKIKHKNEASGHFGQIYIAVHAREKKILRSIDISQARTIIPRKDFEKSISTFKASCRNVRSIPHETINLLHGISATDQDIDLLMEEQNNQDNARRARKNAKKNDLSRRNLRFGQKGNSEATSFSIANTQLSISSAINSAGSAGSLASESHGIATGQLIGAEIDSNKPITFTFEEPNSNTPEATSSDNHTGSTPLQSPLLPALEEDQSETNFDNETIDGGDFDNNNEKLENKSKLVLTESQRMFNRNEHLMKATITLLTRIIDQSNLKLILVYEQMHNARNLVEVVTQNLLEIPIIKAFEDIITAIAFLHEKKVIHQDIRGKNVYFCKQYESGQQSIKISDANIQGLVPLLPNRYTVTWQYGNMNDSEKRSQIAIKHGYISFPYERLFYYAPELFIRLFENCRKPEFKNKLNNLIDNSVASTDKDYDENDFDDDIFNNQSAAANKRKEEGVTLTDPNKGTNVFFKSDFELQCRRANSTVHRNLMVFSEMMDTCSSEKTDWYSCGTILYYLLTAHLPFREAFTQIVKEEQNPIRPSNLSTSNKNKNKNNSNYTTTNQVLYKILPSTETIIYHKTRKQAWELNPKDPGYNNRKSLYCPIEDLRFKDISKIGSEASHISEIINQNSIIMKKFKNLIKRFWAFSPENRPKYNEIRTALDVISEEIEAVKNSQIFMGPKTLGIKRAPFSKSLNYGSNQNVGGFDSNFDQSFQ